MDIGLPDMTGYEVTKKIIACKNSPNYNTPIVALTAHEEMVESCINAGMVDLIPKPLSEDNLDRIFAYLIPKET